MKTFFSVKGSMTPCGLFSIGHFILLGITILCIAIAIKLTMHKNKEQIHKIIQIFTIIICALEIAKILFNLLVEKTTNVNEYVPLYYCSLLIYAGIFSSFGKGAIRKVGDVFLATGAIVGGIIFVLFPTTSLPAYPTLHFISIHSFFFHGTMIYLGLLVNFANYVELQITDIKYYAGLVTCVCILAYIMNQIHGSNLMFISQNFPGTILEIMYNALGPFFTIVMSLIQIIGPFYFMYGIISMLKGLKNKLKN